MNKSSTASDVNQTTKKAGKKVLADAMNFARVHYNQDNNSNNNNFDNSASNASLLNRKSFGIDITSEEINTIRQHIEAESIRLQDVIKSLQGQVDTISSTDFDALHIGHSVKAEETTHSVLPAKTRTLKTINNNNNSNNKNSKTHFNKGSNKIMQSNSTSSLPNKEKNVIDNKLYNKCTTSESTSFFEEESPSYSSPTQFTENKNVEGKPSSRGGGRFRSKLQEARMELFLADEDI
jgi:hypothetical protein